MHYKDGTKAVLGDIAHPAVLVASNPQSLAAVSVSHEYGAVGEFELVQPNPSHPLPRD